MKKFPVSRVVILIICAAAITLAAAIVVDELTAPPCVEFAYQPVPMGKVTPMRTVCKRRASPHE